MPAIETILRSWLADSDITIFCGDWSEGTVMEMLPRGGASLSDSRYEPPFDGVRELRIDGSGHHVHLDLARLASAAYVIAPSVCFGFRASFELRLCRAGADPLERFGLGIALNQPYAGHALRTDAVERYLARAAEHLMRYPDQVTLRYERARAPAHSAGHWDAIDSLLASTERQAVAGWPALRAALEAQAASRMPAP